MTLAEFRDLALWPLVREPSPIEVGLASLVALQVLVTVWRFLRPARAEPEGTPLVRLARSTVRRTWVGSPSMLGILALLLAGVGYAPGLSAWLGDQFRLDGPPETMLLLVHLLRWAGAVFAASAIALLGFACSWVLSLRMPEGP
jgi:hypothetical protein